MTSVQAGSLAEPAFTVPALSDGVTLWMLRHGETEWSLSGQHTGTTDLPLTEAGEAQARALHAVLDGVDPVFVLCSPLRRARDTALLAGIEVDDYDDDLREWNYGVYEGRTTAEIRRDIPGWTLWTHGVPGGETSSQVSERADRVLTRAAARLGEGPVVLIGHGHLSRVLGARWIGLRANAGANLLLGTAAPSVLGMQHGAPVITHWNLPNPATQD